MSNNVEKDVRQFVYDRDGMTCWYCARTLTPLPVDRAPTPEECMAAPTLDHWVPVGRGGARQSPNNIVVSCRPCNNEKGPLTGDEYLAVLVFRQRQAASEAALAAA